RRPPPPHARRRAPVPGRQPARRDRAAPRREGASRRGRARLRRPRRPKGGGGDGAVTPRNPRPGSPRRRADERRADSRRTGAAVVEDAFGLARREAAVPAAEGFVVYPRLVDLDSLFSDAGPGWSDGRRLLLRRPAGFELHTVREYERGDSLRAVHWRSTAKRG